MSAGVPPRPSYSRRACTRCRAGNGPVERGGSPTFRRLGDGAVLSRLLRLAPSVVQIDDALPRSPCDWARLPFGHEDLVAPKQKRLGFVESALPSQATPKRALGQGDVGGVLRQYLPPDFDALSEHRLGLPRFP